MATGTARKPSAKSNLDIAKAIASLQERIKALSSLQEQVKANSEAIKQVLPKDKVQVSNNTVLSIVFVVLVAMIGWIKIDQNGLRQELSNTRQELSNTRQELSSKIDKVSDRLDKIYTLLLKSK